VADASVKEKRAAIGELARAYTNAALEALAQVMRTGQSETVRVAAATALLDRGYGRPPQAVTGGGRRADPMAHRRAPTFLDGGRLCMSNNAAELALRGTAGRASQLEVRRFALVGKFPTSSSISLPCRSFTLARLIGSIASTSSEKNHYRYLTTHVTMLRSTLVRTARHVCFRRLFPDVLDSLTC
jgi:hypothetical protein